MHNHRNYFKSFKKVTLILVDAHEPGAPGKKGRAWDRYWHRFELKTRNRWYDYVSFTNHKGGRNNYELRFSNELAEYGYKLKVYATYQRSQIIKGYSFQGIPGISTVVRQDDKTHTSIVTSKKTQSMLKAALLNMYGFSDQILSGVDSEFDPNYMD
jgi:hypothetical protein